MESPRQQHRAARIGVNDIEEEIDGESFDSWSFSDEDLETGDSAQLLFTSPRGGVGAKQSLDSRSWSDKERRNATPVSKPTKNNRRTSQDSKGRRNADSLTRNTAGGSFGKAAPGRLSSQGRKRLSDPLLVCGDSSIDGSSLHHGQRSSSMSTITAPTKPESTSNNYSSSLGLKTEAEKKSVEGDKKALSCCGIYYGYDCITKAVGCFESIFNVVWAFKGTVAAVGLVTVLVAGGATGAAVAMTNRNNISTAAPTNATVNPTTPSPVATTESNKTSSPSRPTLPSLPACDSFLDFINPRTGLENKQCDKAARVTATTETTVTCGSTYGVELIEGAETDLFSCIREDEKISYRHLWYILNGTGGRITISTCHNYTNTDTEIAVYADSDCYVDTCLQTISYFIDGDTPAGGVNAANNTDENCHLTDSGASTVVFDSELGQEYKFYVADSSKQLDGTFGLTVTAHDPPTNDKCEGAATVEPNGLEIVGSTVNATISSEFNTCWESYADWQSTHFYNISGATVWYKLVGHGGRISITTCSGTTTMDTAIGVYANSDCFDGTCMQSESYIIDGGIPAGGVNAANNTDENCHLTDSGASTVVFDSELGQDYKFYVSDVTGRLDGTFGLIVTAHDPPTNDNCEGAMLVEPNGTEIVGSTVNATISSKFNTCWDSYTDWQGTHFNHISGATVWYKVVGHGGRISITTCSGTTTMDTAIGVYANSDCNDGTCMQSEYYIIDGGTPAGGVNAANNTDEKCLLTDSGASTVVFDSELGQEYKFYVSDVTGRLDGTFGLTVTAHDPPTNDKCEDATLVEPNGLEIVGSTVNATINHDFDSCWQTYTDWEGIHMIHINGATVWYKVIGHGGRISITTCSGTTTMDTAIGVYANTDCFDGTCMHSESYIIDGGTPAEGVNAANNTDENCHLTDSGASTVVFDSELGQEYKFYVADVTGRLDGTFGLTVTAHDPPTNDKCEGAILVEPNGTEILGTTVNATIDSIFDSCWQTYTDWQGTHRVHIRGASVWYKVLGTGRNMTITTCSERTNVDTAIGVYVTSDCVDYTCLEGASNDNDEACTLTETGASSVEFSSVAGQEYKFYVSDVSGRLDGLFGLSVLSQ